MLISDYTEDASGWLDFNGRRFLISNDIGDLATGKAACEALPGTTRLAERITQEEQSFLEVMADQKYSLLPASNTLWGYLIGEIMRALL